MLGWAVWAGMAGVALVSVTGGVASLIVVAAGWGSMLATGAAGAGVSAGMATVVVSTALGSLVLSNGLVGVASARVGVVSASRDRPAISSLERVDAQPAMPITKVAVATATAVDKGLNFLLMMTLQS